MGWAHLHIPRWSPPACSASRLTQQDQDRPFIGHNDLCKRSPASSWFCTLVLVVAAALRENVASRPLAYPGSERAHEMISRLGEPARPSSRSLADGVRALKVCNWHDNGYMQ